MRGRRAAVNGAREDREVVGEGSLGRQAGVTRRCEGTSRTMPTRMERWRGAT